MKHHFASWFSIPEPNGSQYVHIRPVCPPWAGAGCGSGAAGAGAGARGGFGAGAEGADWVTSGVCVSLSRACETTSDQAKVVPYSAALVARMFSSDVYIA